MKRKVFWTYLETKKNQLTLRLFAGAAGEHVKQFPLALGIEPLAADAFVVITTALCRQPNLLQGFLQIHHNLAVIFKRQSDHAARALVVDIGIGFFVDTIAIGLNRFERVFRQVQKFNVSHYNAIMKNISQIVNRVIAMMALGLSLAGLTLSLAACGQRGPLYIPSTPAAAQRATLVETLTAPPAAVTTPAPTTPDTATPAK